MLPVRQRRVYPHLSTVGYPGQRGAGPRQPEQPQRPQLSAGPGVQQQADRRQEQLRQLPRQTQLQQRGQLQRQTVTGLTAGRQQVAAQTALLLRTDRGQQQLRLGGKVSKTRLTCPSNTDVGYKLNITRPVIIQIASCGLSLLSPELTSWPVSLRPASA